MEPSETTNEQQEEQVVTPWEVSSGGKIDYDKLIDRFGCQRIDQSLVQRVERLTSQPAHVFLRRNVFFAHRYHFFFLCFFAFSLLNESVCSFS
jgi:tryptophanyl-tRNA synthetase